MTGDEKDLRLAIQQTTERLQQELKGRIPEATIDECVNAALAELSDARIKTYVPVLTYRLARERLALLLNGTRN